ncbi:MAG: hypothetical protein P8170_04280 [Gemmatimonadota bacterium]|jgi:hypothetical protein
MGAMAWMTVAVAITTWGGSAQDEPDPGRLYGRVTTAGGRVYEGYLRWDGNEGSWSDLLDGDKDLPWENFRDARLLDPELGHRSRERSVSIFGFRISWSREDLDFAEASSSGIRFGHLRSLAVMGDDRALLTLKSGEELELHGGSTDLGDELRSLVIEDPERGRVDLRWRDLDLVEFMSAPPDASAPTGTRLAGTLRTRGGVAFTGLVAWDRDEILTTDVLQGEEGGVDVEFPFSSIARIQRAGSSGARVTLIDGEVVMLRGSNDVNVRNRGIGISDPQLGQVLVEWDAFDELVFHEAAEGNGGYPAFDGGRPLHGSVETETGELLSGWIRWDNDEQSTWELLDGEDRDASYDIELGQVAVIRPLGSWGAEVTLRDGRVLELEGSNDIDGRNRGIYVTLEDGEVVLVPWWDLREAVFFES